MCQVKKEMDEIYLKVSTILQQKCNLIASKSYFFLSELQRKSTTVETKQNYVKTILNDVTQISNKVPNGKF